MKRALVLGSVNIDRTYELEHIVTPGETVRSLRLRTAWGGKGLNQAIALAKAGAPTALAAQVNGEDMAALRELCGGFRLDTDRVRPVALPTGHAIIQVDQNGQNSIIVEPGANGAMEDATIDGALAGYGHGDVLLLQNEVDRMPEIIRRAHDRGLTVALNPSPITKEIGAWPLDMVDIFLVNETEGTLITGEEAPGRMLDIFRKRWPHAAVVLTLGADGACYGKDNDIIWVQARRVKAVDTTAAGDTFSGYFLASLLRDKTPQEAMDLATAASAVTVSRPGAADSIPLLAELDAAGG